MPLTFLLLRNVMVLLSLGESHMIMGMLAAREPFLPCLGVRAAHNPGAITCLFGRDGGLDCGHLLGGGPCSHTCQACTPFHLVALSLSLHVCVGVNWVYVSYTSYVHQTA